MSSDRVSLNVKLVDKSRTDEKVCQGSLYQSVWRFGQDAGMLLLSTLTRGYIFTHGHQQWSSLRYPNLKLGDAGVVDGSTVEFTGDFDPSRAAPLILEIQLRDRHKTEEEYASVVPETSVWDLGMSVGMEKLSTLSGHIFCYEGQRWKSSEHPSLTFAEAGARMTGGGPLAVAFEGDFSRDAAEASSTSSQGIVS